jgi:putative transcriptional regulator
MMIRNHLDPSVLMSYAAGTLPGAISAVVVCHLSMCPQCSADLERLEDIGGLLLKGLKSVHSTEAKDGISALSSLNRDEKRLQQDNHQILKWPDDQILPLPLARYLGMTIDEIPWKTLPKGVRQFWVKLPAGSGLMRLLKVPPGVHLLEHCHRGLELTLILKGIYSDHTGDYERGDVTEMNEGTQHQPRITSEEECICIVACEKAPRYSLWYARLLQPLLGF